VLSVSVVCNCLCSCLLQTVKERNKSVSVPCLITGIDRELAAGISVTHEPISRFSSETTVLRKLNTISQPRSNIFIYVHRYLRTERIRGSTYIDDVHMMMFYTKGTVYLSEYVCYLTSMLIDYLF